MDLKSAFMKLREVWFYSHIFVYDHESEKDSYEQHKDHHLLKEKYDLQTSKIISGEWRPVAPTSPEEIEKGDPNA